MSFTHLEVHSHYTLLGATPSIEELVGRAASDGLSHLALTDTNVLYGAVAFGEACRNRGLQPLLGMTITVAPPADELEVEFSQGSGQLVLLAADRTGYRSLCRLSSTIQGSPEREALAAHGLNWETLKSYREGLLCLSGGQKGWIYRFLEAGKQAAAGRYAAKLGGIYDQSAYLSLEMNQTEDIDLNQEIVALGDRFGIPSVAVQPIYYLNPTDKDRLRLLKAINANSPLETISEELAGRQWRQPEEIERLFEAFPEAVAMAGQIAERCQPALPDRQPVWPSLNLPKGQTAAETLAKEAKIGLGERYSHEITDDHLERLKREVEAINQAGYAPLFLVVADIVRYARQIDVPVSTRGSVANSLVAYALGITTVDPIANELLFERFLNPARVNPPDIDLDFCSRRRDEVLAYVRDTYGADRVALVATISTMRPKSAVREVGKVLGLSEAEISRLARMLPRGWHPDPRRRSQVEMIDILDNLEDPRFRQVVEAANDIIGQPHHLSIHPGGLIITPGPLTDFVPVQWAPKGFLITQFDYRDLESLGLPKLDLLGIRALTVLADAADLVRIHYDESFRLDQIPLDDQQTGAALEEGDTVGVFQCESAGARRTLRQLRARTAFDLAVANAFFKPGPATGGMAKTFIRRYRGEEAVQYLHPALEPILSSTQGVLLFQEQILRVATEIAGLSWAQADHLRRGMSKFQAAEMEAMQAQFISGCCQPKPQGPGFSQEQAQTLWDQVVAFAGYGFNRGHATAYADVSYRSAYLKTHWPAAFFCARLADWGGFHHPAVYMAEAVRLGISVRPPHINASDRSFTLTYDARDSKVTQPVLWMGLGQVRDLRRRSIQAILIERQKQPFNSLRDLVERVDLQRKELLHLIQCGALDGLETKRAMLLAEAEQIHRAGSASQLAFGFAEIEATEESLAQRLSWEKHILGQPVSVHPISLVKTPPKATPLARLTDRGDPFPTGRRVTIAGARLPGWTGGSGFYVGDGQSYVIVRGDEQVEAPKPWVPVHIAGRWTADEWGFCWLQAERMKVYPISW